MSTDRPQHRSSRRTRDDRDFDARRDRGWARRHPIWSTLFVLVALLLVLPLVLVAIAYERVDIPSPGSIATNQISEIYDSDGNTLIGRIVPPNGNRTDIKIDQIPVHVRDAVIAAEDRSFYSNEGFDPQGIGRAVVGQVKGESTAGGGSTITQQYVKNTLVGDEHSYERKFKEILIAAKMTREWTKDQILEAYLNTIYFGRGAYGIDSAAKSYFNKPVQALTIEEGAVLAASIQSPSALDPIANRPAAEMRWNYVLDGMREKDAITAEQRTGAKYPTVVQDPQQLEQNVGDPSNGPIRRQVLAELQASGVSEKMLNTRGLRITTTIDPKTQSSVLDNSRRNMAGENSENRTAVVSMDPRSGAVRGYYGGDNAEGWDYANAPLQTGSSFKVFGLAAALDQGIPLSRMFSSAPITSGNVTINNSDGMSCGTCSIATALKMSLNTSFIRLEQTLDKGPIDVQQMAYKAGIPKKIPGLPNDTLTENGEDPFDGIILGQYPIRVLDMATGLSTFADRGEYHAPHFIEKVVAADGEVLIDNSNMKGEQRVDQKVADNLTSAMEPIAGYSRGHSLSGGRPSAAKSGTTQLGDTGYNKDAWFVGFTPSLVTAVWVGTDKNEPLFTSGGGIMYGAQLPADIWKSVMDSALTDSQWEQFPDPEPIGGQAGAPGDSGYSSSSGNSYGGSQNSYGNSYGGNSYGGNSYGTGTSGASQAPAATGEAPSQQGGGAGQGGGQGAGGGAGGGNGQGPVTLQVPGLPNIVIPGAGGR